jgi:hypothetical protein
MEFVFQTIKLDQVADLVPHTYRSKYEAIRNQVIEKIKTMAGDETFMFQPQDRKAKLDDNLIARICHGINTGLVRESLNWKISFSNKARAFVVAPFKRYKLGKYKTRVPATQVSTTTNDNDAVTDDEAAQLTNLLKVTHQHFGKTLKDLQVKLDGTKDPELSNVKKAFLYVGRNAMGIKLSHIGKLLGLQSSSTTTMCQRAMKDPTAKEYVKVLTDALTTNGGGH